MKLKTHATIRECDTCCRMFEETTQGGIPEQCPFCGSLETVVSHEIEKTYRDEGTVDGKADGSWPKKRKKKGLH
jgi:hypothetical protein